MVMKKCWERVTHSLSDEETQGEWRQRDGVIEAHWNIEQYVPPILAS